MGPVLHVEVEGLTVPVRESADFTKFSGLQSTVMPVVSLQDGYLECWGTAVCVGAAGWFLTARHVVDDFVKRYGEIKDGSAGLFILWETDERLPGPGDNFLGAPLAVEYIHPHSSVDLVAMTGRLPPQAPDRLRVARLALRMPDIGEPIAVVGYRHMSLTGEVKRSERSTVQYERILTIGAGEVLEQQYERRSTGLRGSPGVVIDAPVHPGMSGGPAFDVFGDVIGFASSSMQPSAPGEAWNSFIALAGPALELDVMAREFDDSDPRMMTFAELVAEDAILTSMDQTFDVDEAGRVTFLRLQNE